jgi:hypothetical protein
MPIPLASMLARSRAVTIEGVGELVIREPTLADVQRSSTDPYWWVSCVSCPDGSPFLDNTQDAGKIRSEIAGAILTEINAVRPTHAPKGASFESRPTMPN